MAAYAYDYLNHVTTVGENGLATVLASLSYDSLGRRQQLSRGNGASTTYGYDALDRLTGLAHAFSGTRESQALSYSPASQLISVTGSNSAFDWSTTTGSTRNNTANGLNQDAGIAALSGGGYDGRGNELSDGTRSFAYDPENRLTGDSVGGTSQIALAYDPLGRLQSTTTAAGATQFLYAGDRLVGEYSGGALLDRYVPGPGTDEALVWYQGPGTANKVWLHADHQGSIIAQSSPTGALGQTYIYDPYGVPTTWGGSRYAYTGQIQLPEARLYHYKARAYDPAAGWFLQTDPVGYKDNLDLYAYVHEDPLDHTDPTGNWPDQADWIDLAGDAVQIGSDVLAGGEVAATDGVALAGPAEATVVEGNVEGGALHAEAAELRAGEKTYQTYTKTNEKTGEVYSGRTSGTGRPEQNVARRDSGHGEKNGQGYGPAKLGSIPNHRLDGDRQIMIREGWIMI